MLANRISAFTSPMRRVRGAGGNPYAAESAYGVGSVAHLRAPYEIEPGYTTTITEDASGPLSEPRDVWVPAKTTLMFRKMSNGNWVSQPGQLKYFTSIARLREAAQIERVDIIDPPAPPPAQYAGTDHLDQTKVDLPGETPEAQPVDIMDLDPGIRTLEGPDVERPAGPPVGDSAPADNKAPTEPAKQAQEAAKGISKAVMFAGAGVLALALILYAQGKKRK